MEKFIIHSIIPFVPLVGWIQMFFKPKMLHHPGFIILIAVWQGISIPLTIKLTFGL